LNTLVFLCVIIKFGGRLNLNNSGLNAKFKNRKLKSNKSKVCVAKYSKLFPKCGKHTRERKAEKVGNNIGLKFNIISVKFIAPSRDETPLKCKEKIAKSTEPPECDWIPANGG